MKCVKFLKPLENYRKDDIASFEDDVADRVVKAGYGDEVSLASTSLNMIEDQKKK